MSPSDMLAEIESLRANLRTARDGERLLAGELEGAYMVSKCYKVAAWVFGICFLIQLAVNVWKM